MLGQYDDRAMDTPLSHTTSLAYDPTHRLTSAVATGNSTYNLTFSYDRYGNMTCQTNQNTQGPCPNYSFNTSTNQINTSGFTYDASGDLTNDGTHSYAYDAEGRMVSVDNGSTATYVYNPLGQRVETSVSGTTMDYVFDTAGQPIGSHVPAWWQAYYINFQGRHLANYQSNELYFNHVDLIGTTGMVTDYGGTLKQDELHYPWGQEWTLAGSSVEERFAKLQIRDPGTGLDPTHFRMFSSSVGRWQSPDPHYRGTATDPQSFNRYAYVLNNPTNFNDPQGLITRPCTIDGHPGFCTTSTPNDGIDLNGLPPIATMGPAANVAAATALMGDYIVANANDEPLNPFATAVFSQVGQETGFLENGWTYAGFYGLAAAGPIGYDVATGGELTLTVASGAETVAPGITTAASDFSSGFLGNPTTSWAGTAGYMLGVLVSQLFH